MTAPRHIALTQAQVNSGLTGTWRGAHGTEYIGPTGVIYRWIGSTLVTSAQWSSSAGTALVKPDGTTTTLGGGVATSGINVKDAAYGAVGDGVTNDRTAITNAVTAMNSATVKHIHFPDGTYYLGTAATALTMFSINGAGGPVTISTDGFVKFVLQTTADVIPVIFQIANAVGVRIGDVRFEDTGFNIATTWRGAACIKLLAASSEPVSDVVIDSIYAKSVVNPFVVLGDTGTRCVGIKIGYMHVDTCYYGVNLQGNGDAFKCDLIYALATRRVFFVYGVQGVDAEIYHRNPGSSSGDIAIQAQNAGPDTTDIRVKYTTRNGTHDNNFVWLAIMGESTRSISNISLDLDINNTVSTFGAAVYMQCFSADASTENTGATNNIFTGIRIRAVMNMLGYLADITCAPTVKGTMHLSGISGSRVGQNKIFPDVIPANFVLKEDYLYLGLQQNIISADHTVQDIWQAGKHYLHPSADTTARTITINSNSNIQFFIGTTLTFVNQHGAGVWTIAILTDTMRLAGAGTTGSRTLAANGVATAVKVTATEWIISGTGLT